MSLVGPLVNPNKFEDRFERVSIYTRIFRHPVLGVLLAASALAGAYYLHITHVF